LSARNYSNIRRYRYLYGHTAEPSSPLEEVMDDIRQELVQRVGAADREANREIYDALEDE